ncbi:MAG: Tol-Pal system beta propeller repeat protein TolB [Mariprofundaceae bacterium]|nr:Tol-Pal system beta propeller repeat protein TolB [Mariprofundaceae bacterium]
MRKLLFLSLLLTSQLSHAVEFDIFQSDYKPLNVALLIDGLPEQEKQQALLRGVIQNDLESSQSFRMLNPMGFLVFADEAFQGIDYTDWRVIAANVLVLCRLTEKATVWHVDLQVHQPFQGKQILTQGFEVPKDGLRRLAHQLSDRIYQSILNIPGHFSSQILYVTKHGNKSDLMYMDQDGYNLQAVGKDFTLLLSPDWSPDGRFVALNTYVGNRPRLETFDLLTGKRHAFGRFQGLNSTPEYSPDGRYIAATLSWTGNSNIHIYDRNNKSWKQLTHYRGIDTTPTWSADGKWIAFGSNRSGSPQIYRMPVNGGKAQRISLKGSYNTSPVWSPLGSRIAFITKKKWKYALATARVDGSDVRYLATAQAIESPSWSPNGQMLLYSVEEHGRRRVYRVPSWGGEAVPITAANQDASDPSWSHY